MVTFVARVTMATAKRAMYYVCEAPRCGCSDSAQPQALAWGLHAQQLKDRVYGPSTTPIQPPTRDDLPPFHGGGVLRDANPTLKRGATCATRFTSKSQAPQSNETRYWNQYPGHLERLLAAIFARMGFRSTYCRHARMAAASRST